jgi:hypothetical protein
MVPTFMNYTDETISLTTLPWRQQLPRQNDDWWTDTTIYNYAKHPCAAQRLYQTYPINQS